MNRFSALEVDDGTPRIAPVAPKPQPTAPAPRPWDTTDLEEQAGALLYQQVVLNPEGPGADA